MRASKVLLASLLIATSAGLLEAHVPLLGAGNILHWPDSTPVPVVIQSAGSDDIADGSDVTSLQLAIDSWNGLMGTTAGLVEDTDPAQKARTDWASTGVHLLYFDENNATSLLAPWIVAITPVSFQLDGTIVDADVIFNGRDFTFTTSGAAGAFDIEDVATHELGHLLGLDHSPWSGATMYPFSDAATILRRSLSEDEEHGMRQLHPSGTSGSISGTILRASNSTPVEGAHVVARDSASGRTLAGVLTSSTGSFVIGGLAPGTYDVYAVPLGTGAVGSAPFPASQLSSTTIQTDFEAATFSATAGVAGPGDTNLGTLLVAAAVPFSLGAATSAYPLRAIQGTTQHFIVTGTNLTSGTLLSTSDPDIAVSNVDMRGSFGSFDVAVPAGEIPGHVDLVATSPTGEWNILPAALEITPPSPVVVAIVPQAGSVAGGTNVTVIGSGFLAGDRIVIGDQVYTDGIAGTRVVNPNTITLTTFPTASGVFDVVVLDETGVEGRLAQAFDTTSNSVILSLFPLAGSASGGTRVTLTGAGFQAGSSVRINGVDQGPITLTGSTKLEFTTLAGTSGVQLLELQGPAGQTTAGAFVYQAQADPTLDQINPANAKVAGGETLSLLGSGFVPGLEVLFGVDPDTGLGGIPAMSVTFQSATSLTVETPTFATEGALSVLLRDPSTQQVALLPSGLTVSANTTGSAKKGGGGCTMRSVSGPPTPGSMLAGAWWMLLVLSAASLHRMRKRLPGTTRV